MASDLSRALNSTEEFRQSLGMIRDDQQDYETFFEDVFMRIEATLAVAIREQNAWEQQRVEKEAELAKQAEQLKQQSQALEARREELLAETLTAVQEEFQRQIERQNEASSKAQSQDGNEMQDRLQELEQERSEMLHGRAMLEAELESLRQRAVDLMAALDQQKRLADEQQNQLYNELRRQHQLLEQVLQRLLELEMSPGTSAAKTNPSTNANASDAGNESVLSSVMAQFDVLQKDIARRRNKSIENNRQANTD